MDAFASHPAPVPAPVSPGPPPHMPLRNRILFLILAWVIVLMPFLFWHGTWFGRPLSDRQIDEYLHDAQRPRHTQHALVQIGDRMSRHDPAVAPWYPDLVKLADSPVQEIRNTDAWVMGQDPTQPAFHQALLKMLQDTSPLVRGNAALALVRFGDAAGHDLIVSLLEPAKIVAPSAGKLTDAAKPGTALHQNGLVAKLKTSSGIAELRTSTGGRLRAVPVKVGTDVAAGADIAVVAPPADQVWEALRALFLIGRTEDLPAIQSIEREAGDFPQRVSQQARLTAEAIRDRATK